MQIQSKLIAALILVALLIVSSLYVVLQWTFDRGMLAYVNQRETQKLSQLQQNLARYYQQHNGFDSLKRNRDTWEYLLAISRHQQNYDQTSAEEYKYTRKPRSRNNQGMHQQAQAKPRPKRHRGPARNTPSLVDSKRQHIIGRPDKRAVFHPISVDNRTVGWIAVSKQNHLTADLDIAFRNNQLLSFVIISGLLLMICVLVAVPLARLFVRPINTLAHATKQLTQGKYNVNLSAKGKDELADLTRDIQLLGQTLAQNERQRKLWLSSISHELRTPIAIVLAEVEAILDGVRPLEINTVHSLQQEFFHLQKLIEDLHDLSNAELGNIRLHKTQCDLVALCTEAARRHQIALQKQGIELKLNLPEQTTLLALDQTRIDQVLDNIIGNATKYSGHGTCIAINLQIKHDNAYLVIEDSGKGVASQEHEKLFDYLYRVEQSRNSTLGGSGLGLSICKTLIELHHGQISASASALGGLAITIALPLSVDTSSSTTD